MLHGCRLALICCLLLCSGSESVDPITATVFGGTVLATSVAIALYDRIRCRFHECCTDKYIVGNLTGLSLSLDRRLYGQHLAASTVLKSLQGHLRLANPSRALVLSFHGWTGGGKNHISRLIAEHLYAHGMKSRFVHFFSATIHFPHNRDVDIYKDQLREWIKGNVSLCARSLFIFDEVEKMPSTVLDSIKPYLDHHEEIGSVDYRKSIYIFLSNAGGQAINDIAFRHAELGRVRDELHLRDFEEVLAKQSYNEEGGLRGSALIDRSLVSTFVPFLPLERQHVRLCIRDDLTAKGHPTGDFYIDQVLSELSFVPSTTRQFSKKGCKSVSEKVDLVMEELQSQQHDWT